MFKSVSEKDKYPQCFKELKTFIFSISSFHNSISIYNINFKVCPLTSYARFSFFDFQCLCRENPKVQHMRNKTYILMNLVILIQSAVASPNYNQRKLINKLGQQKRTRKYSDILYTLLGYMMDDLVFFLWQTEAK